MFGLLCANLCYMGTLQKKLMSGLKPDSQGYAKHQKLGGNFTEHNIKKQ